MSKREQQRAFVLTRLMSGEMGVAEAARLLGLSERSIRRLRARMEREGPAALVHGNRGRSRRGDSRRGPPGGRRTRRGRYDGVNDVHLAELLAEHEGIKIGRAALRRLLRGAGRPAQAATPGPRHRSRRDRMPQGGPAPPDRRLAPRLARRPRSTADPRRRDRRRDRAGDRRHVPRPGGHRGLPRDPRQTVGGHGVPLAIYRDRHTMFEPPQGPLDARGAARRHAHPDPARAGLRRARDRRRSRPAARRPRAASSGSGGRSRTASSPSCASRASRIATAPTPSWPATCPATTALLVPAADPVPAWRPLPRGPAHRAGLLPQVPPHRGPRRHGPGGRHDPAAATEGQRARPGPASASSSTCASTAGWSSGTARSSCSRRRPRSTPSSSAPSTRPASRSARCRRARRARRPRRRTTPGAGSGQARDSMPSSRKTRSGGGQIH